MWYSQKEKKDEKKIKERGFKELYKWKVLQTEEGGERKILAKRDCFGQGYLPLGLGGLCLVDHLTSAEQVILDWLA